MRVIVRVRHDHNAQRSRCLDLVRSHTFEGELYDLMTRVSYAILDVTMYQIKVSAMLSCSASLSVGTGQSTCHAKHRSLLLTVGLGLTSASAKRKF